MVGQLIQNLVWILLSGESMDPLKPFDCIWMVVQLAANTVQMVSPCVYKTNGHFWKWKFWMVSNGLSVGGLGDLSSLSVCGNTMCFSQLLWSWGTGSEKNLITQLVSLSLSEIMVQGRTNIGQLVSRLSLSEKYGSERTMGTSRVFLYVSISVL